MGAMVMVRILLSSNDRVCAHKSIDVRGSEEEFRQDEEFVTCKTSLHPFEIARKPEPQSADIGETACEEQCCAPAKK